MFLFLELLFYIGLLVAFIGIVWLIWNLFRKKGKLAIFSLLVIVAGAAISASPAVYTRTIMAVDLGAREKVVDGEYHITLTGWDQTNYAFLQTKHQTVVLQMANPDVDDSILDYIQGMTLLRELDLNDSRITDAGLKKLATLNNLTTLRLRATRISDAGLNQLLQHLPNLNRLDVRETEVTKETIEAWKAAGEGRRAIQ